jgi:hypothetical protein
MPATTSVRRREIARRYRKCPIDCPVYTSTEIVTLSDFFAVFHALLESDKVFWFRGHARSEYVLAPSALRYKTKEERERALGLVSDMKRFLEMKLRRPPAPNDDLGWIQVAQHYGLPTRLLDWTQNAAVALFFACCEDFRDDGLVVLVNPTELNQRVDTRAPRIFDAQRDSQLIKRYFLLDGKTSSRGRHTIAINPTWNTERIALQQGVFTLHGSRVFELDRHQASSLLCVPVLKEHKAALLNELARVGIGEMFIFPEPEHVCSHLRRTANL